MDVDDPRGRSRQNYGSVFRKFVSSINRGLKEYKEVVAYQLGEVNKDGTIIRSGHIW